MAGELVERLRKVSRVLREYGWGSEMVSPPDEAADRIEALERENATLRAERDEARKAITSDFCVVFLDGRNEHGTHVLTSFPTSFSDDADDVAQQAEEIMVAAETLGFEAGDHVWAEFSKVPPQIGDEGRVEFIGYWEFKGIDAEMSKLINVRAAAIRNMGGEG